jgi:4-guanidinobutyraldehyde dehydrogenase/NAD-dependent aldehyde dehydrogenase
MHMDVDCVAFTGSTRTGKLMLEYSGKSNMKRVWLECGGKAPNVVLGDVPDLERAATAAAYGIFFNQGEMCSAASRLVVHESVRDAMLEKIIEIGQTMAPGDPLDPKTRLGAIVDQVQLNTVMGYIESGKEQGAQVRLGGKRARKDSGGFFVEPTVFADVKPEMTISREEIFGPVLAAIEFADLDEAIARANDTPYGLAAGVWTRDIKKAHYVARKLQAGTVWINTYNVYDTAAPFGGYKQSGFGREMSAHALQHYTQVKSVWVDLGM